MKKTLKFFARFLPIFAVTFVLIYLLVFVGGWKFFESKDPIIMEIGVSVLVAVIFYVIDSLDRESKERIKNLEDKVAKLEAMFKSNDQQNTVTK